jgi:methyltransferase-like protein/SAM-dependent methyltransferase
MMSSAAASSYDEIQYEGFARFETHPDHLAALAMLFGVSSPDIETCRVLEVGCACGDNLIPMAVSLPMARFVGIDLSQRQIEAGRATVAALGLANVELLETSIMDVNADFGSFDYVVAHGVYSWITDQVRERLLGLCAERLAPEGLAYISYNTYPGWHMGAMVRDMMLFNSRNVSERMEKVRSSRAFLQSLAQLIAKYNNPYACCLREEIELIPTRPDFYVYHEYLGESNQSVYFHQFVERAAAHGLQYVAEAQFKNMAVAQSPELFRSFSGAELDWLTREQYHDFVTGQSFRQSVLCRDQRTCSRTPSARALMSLRITVIVRPATPVPDSDPGPDASEDFQTFSGQTVFSTGDPLLKTMLRVLWEAWPTSLPFETLRSRIEAWLAPLAGTPDGHPGLIPAQLADALLSCLAKSLINLHVHEPAFTTEVNDFPRASPLARRQAVDGMRVANLRHHVISLLDFDRLVLSYLDGRHDHRALVAELQTAAAKGVFTLEVEGRPVTDPHEVDRVLACALAESLKRLAAGALLL